jgi:uncharacterized cupin superfamily protein
MSPAVIQPSQTDPRNEAVSALMRDGFIGPIRLLTAAQCTLVVRHWQQVRTHAPMEWMKGWAASDRVFYDLATDPALLALLRPLVGDDIVVWGVSIIEREPGETHHWHTDIESSDRERCVSIWIGLENTSRDTALKVVGRSHSFGKTIQQVQRENGRRRGEVSDEMILEWSRRIDPLAMLVLPDMTDGEAIIYDGRLWHSTNNRSERRRTALLMQYAAADAPSLIPDFTDVEWPFHYTNRRMPVIVARGRASAANRVVPPPLACHHKRVTTIVHPFSPQHTAASNEPWQAFGFFHGPTVSLEAMECHASMLVPGHSPHPPHTHIEEELLIALDGEAEILITDGPTPDHARIERLSPGDFVYHPAFQYHTIRNAGGRTISYLMFKWQAAPTVTAPPLGSSIFRLGGIAPRVEAVPFKTTLLFEHPTAFLSKLHAHATDLQPGAGYEPHADEYDVAIVVLAGKVETLGRIVEPFGVVYYAAGELHGMRNVGDGPARYLVFEFHAPKDGQPKWADPSWRSAAASARPAEAREASGLRSFADNLQRRVRTFNEWFWSERRPRTHIIEYSLKAYRKIRGLLKR